MNPSRISKSAAILMAGVFAALSTGCVVAPDGGYGYGGGYPGYYEPYGAYYGGWAPNYYVAPYGFRGRGGHWDGHQGGGARAFRSAPASHGMPSIPSQSRGGARDGRSR